MRVLLVLRQNCCCSAGVAALRREEEASARERLLLAARELRGSGAAGVVGATGVELLPLECLLLLRCVKGVKDCCCVCVEEQEGRERGEEKGGEGAGAAGVVDLACSGKE